MRLAKIRRTSRLFPSTYAFGAQYAAKLEVQTSEMVDDIPDCALLINIDTDSTLMSTMLDPASSPCLNGGGDLRICTDPFDDNSRVALEIVYCTVSATPSSRQLQLWIEAGTVSATTGKTLYLLWGIAGASQPLRTAPYGADEVWGQGTKEHVLVSHMEDGVASWTVHDSSPNNHTMNKSVNFGPHESSITPITDAVSQDFTQNTSSHVTIPDGVSLDMGTQFTVAFWFKKSTPSVGYERLFSRKINYDQNSGWEITFVNGSTTQLDVRAANTSNVIINLPYNINDDVWHHVQVSYVNNGDCYAVLDGLTGYGGAGMTPIVDNNTPIVIGSDANYDETNFDGRLAEVRIIDNIYNPGTYVSEYNMQNDPASFVNVTIL